MWLMTKRGFYSVVKEKGPTVAWQVRARERRDLENLKEADPDNLRSVILHTPEADYPWRMMVNFLELQRLMKVLAADVDYPNFKSEVARHRDQKKKLPLYHRIWAVLAFGLEAKRQKGMLPVEEQFLEGMDEALGYRDVVVE